MKAFHSILNSLLAVAGRAENLSLLPHCTSLFPLLFSSLSLSCHLSLSLSCSRCLALPYSFHICTCCSCCCIFFFAYAVVVTGWMSSGFVFAKRSIASVVFWFCCRSWNLFFFFFFIQRLFVLFLGLAAST